MSFELFEDISSNANDFVNSAWVSNRVTMIEGASSGPSGLNDGTQHTSTENTDPVVTQDVFNPAAANEQPITFGVWARIDAGQGTGLRLQVRDTGQNQVSSDPFIMQESWNLFRSTHTFSSNYVTSAFDVRIVGNVASGENYYLSHPFVYVNCQHVELFPDKGYEIRNEKIENAHRVRTGERYLYKWGEFEQTKFKVEFINSREFSLINSWWGANTNLMWVVDTGAQISSMQLMNRRTPISKFKTPLLTEYSGVIELGTY